MQEIGGIGDGESCGRKVALKYEKREGLTHKEVDMFMILMYIYNMYSKCIFMTLKLFTLFARN